MRLLPNINYYSETNDDIYTIYDIYPYIIQSTSTVLQISSEETPPLNSLFHLNYPTTKTLHLHFIPYSVTMSHSTDNSGRSTDESGNDEACTFDKHFEEDSVSRSSSSSPLLSEGYISSSDGGTFRWRRPPCKRRRPSKEDESESDGDDDDDDDDDDEDSADAGDSEPSNVSPKL